jgi:hypothetical protein
MFTSAEEYLFLVRFVQLRRGTKGEERTNQDFCLADYGTRDFRGKWNAGFRLGAGLFLTRSFSSHRGVIEDERRQILIALDSPAFAEERAEVPRDRLGNKDLGYVVNFKLKPDRQEFTLGEYLHLRPEFLRSYYIFRRFFHFPAARGNKNVAQCVRAGAHTNADLIIQCYPQG